jgi:transcriptional regulator with XRE-family HTH domain
MDYGRAIRVARAVAGISQTQLAKTCKINPSHVSLIEKGKRVPSPKILGRIAAAIGIPMHLLVFLGAEEDDYKEVPPDEISEAARLLAKFLVHNKPRSQKGRTDKKSRP